MEACKRGVGLIPGMLSAIWIILAVSATVSIAQQEAAPPPGAAATEAPAVAPATEPPAQATGDSAIPEATLQELQAGEELTPPPLSASASLKRKEMLLALQKESFTYAPDMLNDPFVSFIVPVKVAQPEMNLGDDLPPEPPKPLTPLQRMSQGEIERGLKAILWGDMGRRAIIEDSAGKGYIVSVGTLVGGNNGFVAEIFDDRLLIQEETWDKNTKKYEPHNVMIRLSKKENS